VTAVIAIALVLLAGLAFALLVLAMTGGDA
jgi:hypothetical protein